MKRLIVVRTQISQMNVPNNDKSARGGVILTNQKGSQHQNEVKNIKLMPTQKNREIERGNRLK